MTLTLSISLFKEKLRSPLKAKSPSVCSKVNPSVRILYRNLKLGVAQQVLDPLAVFSYQSDAKGFKNVLEIISMTSSSTIS